MITVYQKLPPGIIYLLQHIPQLLLGPTTTWLLLTLYNFHLPTWMTILFMILSGPVLFAISLAWNDFNDYRAAQAIGAVLPPRILDYSPGNVYSIWKEIQNEKIGYYGEFRVFCAYSH